MRISQLGDLRCVVGEGPVWAPEEEALYVVDIVGQWVHRLEPSSGAARRWRTPAPVAAVARSASGCLLAVLADGVYAWNAGMDLWQPVARAAIDPARTPFNDAKADRRGRLLAGTCVRGFGSADAGLYQLRRGRSGSELTRVDDGYVLANGPCWSPAGETLYCADSMRHVIYAYDYDVQSGVVGHRRVFVETRSLGGIPDGATVDTDGRLWVALSGAGQIACFTPNGGLERAVAMPTLTVAGVAFGGRNRDRLFVTSLDPSVIGGTPDPLAGALFVIDGLGARGIDEAPVSDSSCGGGPCP